MSRRVRTVFYYFRRQWLRLPKFVIALFMIITTALIMTAVSISIYTSSGVQNIDLSRPGYEQARRDLTGGELTNFNPEGPLNPAVVDSFSPLYSARVEALHKLDAFSDDVLDDSTLGLFNPDSASAPAP